jgi:acetylornithine deacetylase/succinyl-diaminopimelate desuccinylase-like protein
MSRFRLFALLCLGLLLTDAHAAEEQDKIMQALRADPKIRAALDFLKRDDDKTLADQIALTEIASPPYKETRRIADFTRRLTEAGASTVRVDETGNVIALRKGSGSGPTLVLSAHLDTVFPEGTDVKVRKNGDRYEAPGIGDDGRGLAELLSIARALYSQNITTIGDIMLVATVGEEELGDLRGVKALFKEEKSIDGFISIDGTGIDRIVTKATGSRRYKIRFTGPGGHSFGAFGLPSAIHAMGRAIAGIADIEVPADPKTTFNVGTVHGGSSVTGIAADAEMGLDMRSNSAEELSTLEAKVMAIVQAAVKAENHRAGDKPVIAVEIKKVGDRPAGAGTENSAVAQAAHASMISLGITPKAPQFSSTDSNVAINLGLPAATVGGGGKAGGAHSPGEWYTPDDSWRGPQVTLLTVLELVGVDGVSQPTLPKRP